jgi:class 3 adenylate cyclase/tetratricopeptide (TPR) repeat protein
MPVCAACGQENPEVANFCLACGSPLAPAELAAASAEERKLITAVFCDLVGSTARSESLDVEDVKELVSPYHARVRAELEGHGGTFEKFSGDAILALFGTPRAHEDDPERAVRAALAVRRALAELNAQDEWLDLHFRIGVNTGEALVMLDARPSEGEWSAAGDVMNTAARIESAAPVDGILVGEVTYRATQATFEFREAEPITAKGKSEPVPVWEVVGEKEIGERDAVAAPLVGRDPELELLLRFATETFDHAPRPAMATIVGSPGVGKTRLLAEVTSKLDDRCAVYRGRCLSYGEGITYWPVNEIIKAAAGIRHDDDAETNATKLGMLLRLLPIKDADQLRTIATALSNLSGVATTPLGTYSAQELSQAELHWGLRRLFELLAETGPTVLVFEDLHWAEPTLLDFLRFVLDSNEQVPLAVLGSARPEALETGAAVVSTNGNRRLIELDALGADASSALVDQLLPESLPGPARQKILEHAGGNPLFIEEMVRMLAERTDVDPADVPVPETLQALIASRLDLLARGEKRLAQSGAVVGAVFWVGAISHLDTSDLDVEGGLRELERRDLVRSAAASTVAGEREFAFKHILIRDVAYGQLPKRRRSVLHARVAEWVDALPGGEDEFVEIVAYHLEQACLLAQRLARPEEPPPIAEAVATLTRAGAKAERREGMREAERFYTRALRLAAGDTTETIAELRLRHARVLVALGEVGRARDELLDVEQAALGCARADLRGAALVALANIDWKQGHVLESHRHVAEAEAVASAIRDKRLLVRVIYESAFTRALFEGSSEAADDVRRGLSLAQELGDRELLIDGHMRLGFMLSNAGRLVEAEQELLACIELAGEVGSHRDEARVTYLLGFIKYYLGEREEAERLAHQAEEWLERTCDSLFQVQNYRTLAIFALARGDLELAEERLRQALPLALELGKWFVLDTYRYLVDVLVHSGRLDDARALLEFADRDVSAEDQSGLAALRLAQAVVATADGDRAAAVARFEDAARLFYELNQPVDLGESCVSWGRALESFGDAEGAREQLLRARLLFDQMGAAGRVAEIDALLGESRGAGLAGPSRAT